MMVTRLMKHDLCEMVLEWPMPNIVKGKRTEKNNYRIDNTYLKATFEEISTPLFSIMDQHISSEEPIKIYTRADDYHAVWFCATFAGHATCCYNSVIRSEEWNKGDANLLKCDGVDSCVHGDNHVTA